MKIIRFVPPGGIWPVSSWEISSARWWCCLCLTVFAGALFAHAQVAPVLLGQPQNALSWEGGSTSFSVSAQGSAPMQYLWQRRSGGGDWQDVVPGGSFAVFLGGRLLSVNPVSSSMHQDEFRCMVTNADGMVVSNVAMLRVGPRPPSFLQDLGWVYAAAGSEVTIAATVVGDAPMTFQWYRHNTAIEGAVTATLTLTNVQPANDGSYTLQATNPGGTRSSTAELRVVFPPTAEISSWNPVVRVGGQLDISGSTTAFHGVSFQWLHDGEPVPGATSLSFSKYAGPTDGGLYQLQVTNAAGTATSDPLKIEIIPAPVPQPTLQLPLNPDEGGSFAVSGYTSNTANPVAYQWYFNGIPLAGENGPQLLRSPVTTQHVGEYFVTATNEEGTGLSSSFRLGFNPSAPASAADWVAADERDGVIYFLFADQPRIERFELQSRSWLPTWTLPAAPRCFALTASHLLIGFANSVVRYDAGFGSPATLTTTADTIEAVGILRGQVVAIASNSFGQTTARVLRWSDGATLSEQRDWFPTRYVHFDDASGRLVGVRSLSSVYGMTLTESWAWADLTFHHTLDSSVSRFWPIQPGDRIVTGNGTVRDSRAGTLLGGAGGTIDGICEDGAGGWLVLRPDSVGLLDGQWREIGRKKIGRRSRGIWRDGSDVVVFARAATGARPEVETVPLAAITPPPLQPLAGAGGAVPAAMVLLGTDDTVYINNRVQGNVWRWSPRVWRYLPSLPLAGNPSQLAVVDEHGAVYYPHEGDYVRRGSLDQGGAAPFASALYRVVHLAGSGNRLVLEDESAGNPSRRLRFFDPSGEVRTTFLFEGSTALQWSPSNRRLYWVGSGSAKIGSIAVNTDDTLGSFQVNNDANDAHSGPLRIAGDASYVLTGDGAIYDGALVTKRGQVTRPFVDAVWAGDALVVVREHLQGTRLTRLSLGGWVEQTEVIVPGRPVRLLTLSDGNLLLVTHQQSVLGFSLLEAATLSVLPPQVSFADWRETYFTGNELADATRSGAAADYAGDGVPNLLKYALGLAPQEPAHGLMGEVESGPSEWVYRYRRPAHVDDITYQVEWTSDLQQWATTSLSHVKVGTDGDFEIWEARTTVPTSRAFFRLRVSRD